MMFADASGSFSNVYVVVEIFTVLIIFIVGALSAKVRLKAGKESTNASSLEESNRAWEALHKTDQLTIAARENDVKLLKKDILLLEEKAKVLESLKTGSTQIIQLIEQNATQHTEVMGGISNLIKAITKGANRVK
jgi:septal ring-binding cell division protein DamX